MCFIQAYPYYTAHHVILSSLFCFFSWKRFQTELLSVGIFAGGDHNTQDQICNTLLYFHLLKCTLFTKKCIQTCLTTMAENTYSMYSIDNGICNETHATVTHHTGETIRLQNTSHVKLQFIIFKLVKIILCPTNLIQIDCRT